MRIGYGLLTAQRPPADPRTDVDLYREAVEVAVAAERAGFDSVWTSEHHFVDDGYMPSQMPVLAAIAARTGRILLGTGVLLAPMFDPLRLAEDAATVDLISDGRLILGLGLGWRDEEFDGFGIPRRERAGRLTGIIATLRQAWGDGLTHGDGRYYRYPGLNVTPKPARPGGPPIWIGGWAEPAVRRAGRISDGYFGSGASPAALAERAGWLRAAAEEAGRDPATVTIALHRTTFAWREGDAWERIRDAAHYMSWKYEDMASARGSRSAMPQPQLDSSTEAALRRRIISGSPEAVADQIRAYADILAADGLYVARAHFPGLDPAVQDESFRVLGEEVLPLLRA